MNKHLFKAFQATYDELGWKTYPTHMRLQAVSLQADAELPLLECGSMDAILLKTGNESSIIGLEVNPLQGGDRSLREIEESFGLLPETPTIDLGECGRIYLFKCTPNVQGWLKSPAPGLRVVADGDWLALPPTPNAYGQMTYWLSICPPQFVALAPPPSWFKVRSAEPMSPFERSFELDGLN